MVQFEVDNLEGITRGRKVGSMIETLEPIGHPWYMLLLGTMGLTIVAITITCLFPPVRKELLNIATQLGVTIGNLAANRKASAAIWRFLSG